MLETGRNADMAVHIVKDMHRNLYVKQYSSEHLYCDFYFFSDLIVISTTKIYLYNCFKKIAFI